MCANTLICKSNPPVNLLRCELPVSANNLAPVDDEKIELVGKKRSKASRGSSITEEDDSELKTQLRHAPSRPGCDDKQAKK